MSQSSSQELAPSAPAAEKRSLERFLAPLLTLAGIEHEPLGNFQVSGRSYSLPRFRFLGPNSADPIRIGIFGAIHGDEPAGALAAVKFLQAVSLEPEIADRKSTRLNSSHLGI